MAETYVTTAYERLQIAHLRWRKRLQKWISRSREKVSFVLIPNDEKPLAQIEISVGMLGFLFGLSLSLVLLSFGLLLYFSFFFERNLSLEKKTETQLVSFLFYDLLSKDLRESVEELESMTESLNLLAWEEIPEKEMITQDYLLKEEFRKDASELDSNLLLFQQVVTTYTQFGVRLGNLVPNFQNAIDYLSMRESIFYSMPRGRPLKPGVGVVTSTFGYRSDPFGILPVGEYHSGIDFAAGEGTPIYATGPGIIAVDTAVGGLGKSVRINHENGFFTLYGHCSQILVNPGDRVKRGDKIALVGQTGKATGAHVHYEVRIGLDAPLDPEEYINLD
ncbi:M23 family metallopeptidase [Leptospira biflexa]|uniref:Putative membrane associated metalloendopeptidase n=1 Tax=Leptospira biflexa serovar Patoc (strain Patoc 1 / ATCC 23582 / Paris) TaxID=456481 RepID=B0SPS8_LEPBP|nr:M23 family metallopeptidase [Leptospira biflexa]ABZ93851.1 Metalloendopeptidase [Leptospira biflexa serovar Patoc strain 'Patoc 1 (Ames)']ABZ97494.1 Putative membrane associated metalloendopeptidase [Leptospira biflexa serovar Patoc strain 'Patoc 1 (Paris)']TGM48232.1 M23 family metallopeptidase [Leptospira biflexa]TGM49302.1 M23 family metallopeptidase [Leptospira biflexa]